jgi:hypothetical protein
MRLKFLFPPFEGGLGGIAMFFGKAVKSFAGEGLIRFFKGVSLRD